MCLYACLRKVSKLISGGIVSNNNPLNCSREFVPSSTQIMGEELAVCNILDGFILDGFTLQSKTRETPKSSDPIAWEHKFTPKEFPPRSRSKSCKNDVALMWHCFPTTSQWSPLKKTLLVWEKKTSSLVPILSLQLRSNGCFNPRFVGPGPYWKSTLVQATVLIESTRIQRAKNSYRCSNLEHILLL